MCADVIGMTVPAELVVGRHHVGLVEPHQPGQPSGGLVEVGHPVVAGVAVAVGAHHPGVAVPEVLPLGHAEDPHRPLELAGTDLAEAAMVVRRVHVRHDDLAELTACPGDENDAMTRLDGLRHRAAGSDGLVVRMGVHGHERRTMRFGGVRHVPDAIAPRTSWAFLTGRMAATMAP